MITQIPPHAYIYQLRLVQVSSDMHGMVSTRLMLAHCVIWSHCCAQVRKALPKTSKQVLVHALPGRLLSHEACPFSCHPLHVKAYR